MEISEKTIGKVLNMSYKTGYGEAITYDDDEIYMFTIEDIISNGEIAKGDYITFRKEHINDNGRAFFVKKISKKDLESEEIQEYLKKSSAD